MITPPSELTFESMQESLREIETNMESNPLLVSTVEGMPRIDTRVYRDWPVDQTKQFPTFRNQWAGNDALTFANKKREGMDDPNDVWIDLWGANDDPYKIIIVCWRLPKGEK
jgi:hypothetical protein